MLPADSPMLEARDRSRAKNENLTAVLIHFG